MPARATIAAIHHCVPANRLMQAELEERFGAKNVQSIAKLSGILERRVVPQGMTAADLAHAAADRLLTARNVDRASIDLLILATQTGDYQMPATACILHERLGLAENCATFDINLGCSAYPYALAVANGFFATGQARRALILNADALSTVIHPHDRNLVPLQGDGAAATLLEPTQANDEGLMDFHFGTDGKGWNYLCVPASGARTPRSDETRREQTDESGSIRTAENLFMNGPAVFHFSLHKVPEAVQQALAKFKTTLDDIDLVILHQANRYMLEQIYKKLHVPAEKQFFHLEDIGNLSGASTPVALSEAVRQGRVRAGSRVLLVSFGVGLSWGISLLRFGSAGIASITASTDLA